MLDFERLVQLAFTPKFMAMANFTAFGVILALGIWNNSTLVMSGCLGFFIAGACISVLYIADGWIQKNPADMVQTEIVQTGNTNTQVKPNGVPKNNAQIQTSIE
jgi:hypothetical protein